MKKLKLFAFGFLFFFSASAQQYFPFPSDNPFWTEQHDQLSACSPSGGNPDCGTYYCHCTRPVYYKSDTLINGTIYNRLYTRGICFGEYIGWGPPYDCYSYSYSEPEFLLASIRQDTLNKTVYIWEYDKDVLLYDFKNMVVGQDYPKTYNNPFQDTLVIVAEDSVLLGDVYHKKWGLGTKYNGEITEPGFVSIIDGIGSTFGIIAWLELPFEDEDELLCYSENDVVLYPDSTFDCDKTLDIPAFPGGSLLRVYPNPASSILTIETFTSTNRNSTLKIFNTSGQKLLEQTLKEKITPINISTFNGGIYFVQLINGKSVETKTFIKK